MTIYLIFGNNLYIAASIVLIQDNDTKTHSPK